MITSRLLSDDDDDDVVPLSPSTVKALKRAKERDEPDALESDEVIQISDDDD